LFLAGDIDEKEVIEGHPFISDEIEAEFIDLSIGGDWKGLGDGGDSIEDA
jgi:hypothetical protein